MLLKEKTARANKLSLLNLCRHSIKSIKNELRALPPNKSGSALQSKKKTPPMIKNDAAQLRLRLRR